MCTGMSIAWKDLHSISSFPSYTLMKGDLQLTVLLSLFGLKENIVVCENFYHWESVTYWVMKVSIVTAGKLVLLILSWNTYCSDDKELVVF